MNIVTICTVDWVATQLTRFVYMTRKSVPDAKLYLLIPLNGGEEELVVRRVISNCLNYFTAVKTVKVQELSGRLLYYDYLRAGVLDIFGLSEGLYTDPDVDIVEDVSDLVTLHPEVDLLWTPNPLHMPLVPEALKANGLPAGPPYMDCGFMYMRRSFKEDCTDVLATCSIDKGSIAPGMAMWNIVTRRANAHALPVDYHTSLWGFEHIPTAKAVHFTGEFCKRMRLHTNYVSSVNGRRLLVGGPRMRYPDIKLWE